MSDYSKINWKGEQPLPSTLAKRLKVNFPQITQTGIYNDRNVAGTSKKSSHAEGRALDIHLNVLVHDQKILGDQLFKVLIRKASVMGIDNVIWNREIWSQARGGPRKYEGKNSHTDHIHVEFTRDGSQNINLINEIDVDIATIRTGMEDLMHGRENIA